MVGETLPLRFGSKVRFADRWAGRVTGFEVDEAWEVLNLLVTGGLLRPTTVKLPFDAATWDADHVAFAEVTSTQAFAREVPPVAAPARPLSSDTPVSMPGARVAGGLVERQSRRVTDLLLTRGRGIYRVPVDQVMLSGKELAIRAQADALVPYYSDEELTEDVREAIAKSGILPEDELRSLEISVENRMLRLGGSVRTNQSLEAIRKVVSSVSGISGASIEVVDDISLEFAVARALHLAGLSRESDIYPRAALGEVTLFGRAESAEAAAEAVRVASRVPGVRAVRDRLEVRPSQPAAA